MALTDYASALTNSGATIVCGGPETLWIRSETVGMIRIPTFDLTSPGQHEISRVLWRAPAAVVSYLSEPDERHSANTRLYVCQDQLYSLEKLSKNARRDVRRALRHLVIGPMRWPVLLDEGWRPFSETVRRLGLTAGSPDNFRQHYERFSKNPFHHVVGAWKNNLLTGFMTLIVVDDWVEIEGSFFSEDHRGLCPSNGLAHYVLDHFLVQRKFRIISYGTSSVQRDNQNNGLHAYKTKVGFQARPVHRKFVFHPFVYPFVNRVGLKAIEAACRCMPGDRRLRKLCGVLANLVTTENGSEKG